MRLRITCCNGRDVFSAAKPPEKRISGHSINRPMPERSSMIWDTLSSRVASRPAIAHISISVSHLVIHSADFGLEGVRSIRGGCVTCFDGREKRSVWQAAIDDL